LKAQQAGATTADSDRAALEDFVIENRELDRLEALLATFNIFDALGVVRHELRHSDFLAFLLDPKQSHGLGDLFLRRFLQKALRSAPAGLYPLTLVDLDVWNLAEAQVQREWHNIDIFIRDEQHRLAVIIENKIDSGEHSNQLERYLAAVTAQYPGQRLLGILLTPEGIEATSASFAAVSYSIVCSLVDEFVESRGASMADDVRTFLRHYSQMLRRHIVTDSKIADLCRRIYHKHQRALDLIFEHRPDQQASVHDALVDYI
jgi:PD-(D/E)XK nuclease superfamily